MSMNFLTDDPKILQIWTDGAINIRRKDLPGGWSSVYVHKKMLMGSTYAGVAPTTSQRMELTAALMGLICIHETFIDECEFGRDQRILPLKELIKEIEIMSDSAYLVNCMVARWYDNWIINKWISLVDYQAIKNRDLWEPILKYKDLIEGAGYILRFRKVKGHSGLMYNELADSLAVKAKLSMH